VRLRRPEESPGSSSARQRLSPTPSDHRVAQLPVWGSLGRSVLLNVAHPVLQLLAWESLGGSVLLHVAHLPFVGVVVHSFAGRDSLWHL